MKERERERQKEREAERKRERERENEREIEREREAEKEREKVIDFVSFFNKISLGYGELLFNMGLATIPEMNHINSEAARGVELIKEGKYVDAFNVSSWIYLPGTKYCCWF